MVSFLIWKLISGQKEIRLHRAKFVLSHSRGCNYTVDQTDSFVFGGFFPLRCPGGCQGSHQRQFSLAAEQEDGDGWAGLAIILGYPSLNSLSGGARAIQTNTDGPRVQVSCHCVGVNGGGSASTVRHPVGCRQALSSVFRCQPQERFDTIPITILPTRSLCSPATNGHCELISR